VDVPRRLGDTVCSALSGVTKLPRRRVDGRSLRTDGLRWTWVLGVEPLKIALGARGGLFVSFAGRVLALNVALRRLGVDSETWGSLLGDWCFRRVFEEHSRPSLEGEVVGDEQTLLTVTSMRSGGGIKLPVCKIIDDF
jgi:hypothetical protein